MYVTAVELKRFMFIVGYAPGLTEVMKMCVCVLLRMDLRNHVTHGKSRFLPSVSSY